MRVVAILNQKGGVGKTTTAVNLGAALALAGQRVLLIDSDPQGNLTDHLGLDERLGETTVYDVLTDGADVLGAVLETETPGLHVLPADGDLAAVEQELATEIARETRLARALGKLPENTYDWVLIDCPPSLGLLSLNAMTAATGLIVTVQTEYFAMRGLGQLDEIVNMVQEHVNPKLQMLGILPTLVSPVTRLAREVIEEIRGHYGPLVFETRIRQNVRLAEAPGHQVHIFAYDPLSAGAADYEALAVEVQARVDAPVAAQPEAAQPEAVPSPTDAPETAASEAVAPEGVAPEAVDAEAVDPEAVDPEAVDAEAVAREAIAGEAISGEGVATEEPASGTPSANGEAAADEGETETARVGEQAPAPIEPSTE